MSFLGSFGGIGRVGAVLLRHRVIAATAGTATAVIVAGCTFAAASSQETLSNAGDTKTITTPSASASASASKVVPPLRLLSATPGGGAAGANGGAPITLTFSAPLSASTPLPSISPKVAGSWQVSGATATFTPVSGFQPDTKVKVTVPAGMEGAAGSAGSLGQQSTVKYTTAGGYSTLGLQVLLSQLGYLPLTYTPTSGTLPASSTSIAYAPPAGSFAFQSGYPTELTDKWKSGSDNILVTGAVRAFESVEGLTMDGTAGPAVWSDLLSAAAKHQMDPNGYTYALASQYSPHESLQVWHNGKRILNVPANTGIAAAPTADGTFPVYLRLQSQIMKGKNPDGSKYSDQVYWVAYFNGGDAVHYFSRPGYGYYQSLGCVELPYNTAKFIWPYLSYGSLVTVQGPVA